MFHFYDIFLKLLNISSIFSSGIIISSTGSCSTIVSSFELTIVSAILFHTNLPALWTNFLEAVFRASSSVSNNCFSYFLENEKYLHPLTYFVFLGSIVYHRISTY